MKTRVPGSLVFFALLLTFAVEHSAFLPPARAQAAQAGAAVSGQPRAGTETQRLRGHVPAVLAGLQPINRLAATNRLKLAIGLPLRNPEALARFLGQLHDPAHPNYRHYLTPEEFAARFGPTEQDYTAVIDFAQANGLAVSGMHPNRTLLDVSGSVVDIEQALHLTLRVYQHPAEARTFYAPEVEPSLNLAVPLCGISGLNNYSLPRPRLQATRLDQLPAATPNSGAGPQGTYMGGDFRAAYVPNSVLTGAGQTVGLLQFDGYTASDITYYESQAGLPNVPLSNVLLDGFSGNPTGGGGEVEVCLDIEAAISMAPGLAGVIVYMAGPYGNFHDILNRMATDNLAKQLSCSWYMPGAGADAVADQIFQQMAAQGQSFFNASGDYDAFTGPVDFPGETPYIVQVGGTTLTTSGPGGAWVSEKVWNWNNGIGTGGGISTRYAIPSYQADISMTLNQGSTTMRNIPDVALTADNVYVRADGRDYKVGGTSCAAPLWAGFAALVNQQAVASGRPVVGFINPAVDTIGTGSSYTGCFHDITTGDNTRSGSPTKFYAVAGYDLCTGWGTPAGQTLINALATPDALLVSPLTLAFSGVVGGPFSPNPGSLTLTNSGTNALSWTLVNTSGWFNVSPTNGTLLPGGAAASVSVSIDPSANTLAPGVYTAVLALTNQTSGVAQSCSLALSVAALGMADDFDPGLDLSQWSSFGGVVGSTVLATNYGGSVSAPNSLWFGNAGSRFATTIPINTTGGGQIGFCLRLANGPAWPWALVDSLPAEGVVLECSTNGGGSWTTIGNYDTPACYNWTGVALPIPTVAQAPAALFRWRQLSNSGTNYDHWALDNVVIGTGSMAPKVVMDPQGQTVAAGDPASLSVAAVGTPPLSYQWLLNGTNINGATASALAWTNVRLTDAGSYSVFLSNSVGTVTSSNAVLAVYVPVCASPPDGLVSWWAAEGDASDVLGANNGILQGEAGFARGRVGQAFSFNPASGTVVVPDSSSLRLTSQLTIEAWINMRTFSSSAGYAIVSKVAGAGGLNGYQFLVNGNTLVGIFNSPGQGWPSETIMSGPTINTGVWYHVAWTYDQSAMKLYCNGQPVATNVIGAHAIATSISDLHISGVDSVHPYFDGLIDEASVYNRALSANEVAAIYNAGNAGKCQTPAPPSIVTQPQGQTAAVGTSVTLTVGASGTPPLSYQWQFGGIDLAGASNATLTLTNIQMTNAGVYAVVVTNAYGSGTSSNAVLTVVPAPPCAAPPAGLVSWWPGEGDANDAASGNNGTLQGAATFAPGVVGQAFNFNPANGTVLVPDSTSLRLTNQLTIEAWINTRSLNSSDGYPIVSKLAGAGGNNGYQFLVNGNTLMGLFNSPGQAWPSARITSGPIIVTGVWYHVAFTYDQSAMKLYCNGQPVATSVIGAHAIATSISDLHISGVDSVHPYFDGLIDEPSVYNRALSAGEIAGIYNAGNRGKCRTPTPPSILTQPKSQTVAVGANVGLAVVAAGTAPLSYQWRLNATNIPAATGSALALANVQAANAGSYDVVVTNLYGTTNSSVATLAVLIPPQITAQPQDQTVGVGSNVTFTVSATGSDPLACQWYFNGTVLGSATNSTLALSGVSLSQAGSYSVSVSNPVGSATSRNAILVVQGNGSCAPPAAGLVSWWAAEGRALDSVSTNHGTLQGGAAFAIGMVGQAFSFNPASGTVLVPDSTSLRLTNQLTIEAWIKTRSLNSSDGYPIVSKLAGAGGLNGYQFLVNGNTLMGLFNSPGQGWPSATIVSGSIISTGVWYHVAWTYDQSAMKLYCNGQPVATNAIGAHAIATSISDLHISGVDSIHPYFDGLIDEPSLYNRALSAGEIAAIYNAGSAGKCGVPPSILIQPQSQTAAAGSGAVFAVAAAGTPTLSYQWQFNSTAIAGATASSLTLTNLQASQAGTYLVVVSNAVGSVTSSNAALTVVAPPPCMTPPAGLVSWWPAEGNANDAAAKNNGTLQGGATFAAGRVGQTFNFNPASGTVLVPDSPSLRLTNQLTIEAWIKTRSLNSSDGYPIVSKLAGAGGLNGYQFLVVGNTLMGLFNSPGQGWPSATITSGSIIATGVWYHVAWTYDQSAMKLYCNGQSVATNAIGAHAIATSISDLHISGVDSVHPYFDGLIDEPSVYNRALSAAEVAGIYSAGKCSLAPSVQTPPQSQLIQCSSNASFSVTATGVLPLVYQWFFGTNTVLGATNFSLTLTSVGFAQAGNYSVIITNVFGSATGGPAVLTVVDTIPPTIIACASNRTLSAGANCTANLPDLTGDVVAQDASGPVTVTQNPPPGTQLGLGITNVTFTVRDSSGNTSVCAGSVTVADTTPPFVQACVLELTLAWDANCQALLPDLTSTNYIVASDNCSSVSVAQAPPAHTAMPVGTNTVFLTVFDSASNQATRAVAVIVPGEPHIGMQPANLTLAASSNATFSVLACGATPLLCQWQHWSTNLPSATNAVLTLSNIKTNDAGDYRVVVTNPSGSLTSAVATLTVLQPPVITRQPRNGVAAPGATVSFSVTAKGLAPLAYQWQKNSAPLAGQTKALLTISNVQPADFAGYSVGITNTDGGVLSAVAMLTLAASPDINSLSFNSSTFMLTLPTELGPTYVVEYKNDLEDPSWTVLTTLAGTGLSIPITDNGLTNATRFYRVRVR